MRPRLERLLGASILIVALFLFPFSPVAAQPEILGVDSIGMTVSDMDRSVDFFSQVLTFKTVSETEFRSEQYDRLVGIFGTRVRVVKMKLGQEMIELTEYLTPQGRPIPLESRSNDLWFQHIAIVVRDMDAAYKQLRRFNVKYISTEPQRIPEWNKAAAGVRAFYFRDPDNHPLELIYFPPGKGDPRWQAETGNIFLGIDHTAIAVSDTERSLQYYRDVLGFKVVGESLNYGNEQENLNHVFGSRVRITGLRAPEGPGIEFLEYLTPGGGRPYPPDAAANDILHCQVTLIVQDLARFPERLASQGGRFVSSSVSDTSTLGLGGNSAILVRDPDAHALRLMEP
jgi:catechol 2,3-dioxygenase-like lactoylglutathione lyase family enzyme